MTNHQPPKHQSTKAPKHQSTKAPNHQTTKPPNHQTTKPPNHQTTKPPNHQPPTANKEAKMPIKKVANNLTVTRMALGEMRSFVTRSKKSHFTVSEAKLCRHLTIALNTTGGFFVPYISFVPNVAVHVYGREDKLVEHADWLESQILKALTDYHDKGLDKIKAPKY